MDLNEIEEESVKQMFETPNHGKIADMIKQIELSDGADFTDLEQSPEENKSSHSSQFPEVIEHHESVRKSEHTEHPIQKRLFNMSSSSSEDPEVSEPEEACGSSDSPVCERSEPTRLHALVNKINISEEEIDKELQRYETKQKVKKIIESQKQYKKDQEFVEKNHDIKCLNKYLQQQQTQINEQNETIAKLREELLRKQRLCRTGKGEPQLLLENHSENSRMSEREVYLTLKNRKLKATLKEAKEELERMKQDVQANNDIHKLKEEINVLLKYVQKHKLMEPK
ncbi:unnamed protein product [Moneuplotes crassus]|uniref:Uncharacterized protein n=1 Tax=Euplotes crassus TaxID=5936 RepID=A0AAD1XQ08_EUPCR|nr:unnamed protein product [Moneuplotes crassus]